MPDNNKYLDRYSGRYGERIIDVEASLQDAASNAVDRKREASALLSARLPEGPSVDARASSNPSDFLPPAMVSLAEGARIDNIAGRPIHEIIGIQPSGNGQIDATIAEPPRIRSGIEGAFNVALEYAQQARNSRSGETVSGAGIKPITQDPHDDKIPPPPPGENPWGWAEKHGIMPDPGYGVPELPSGEAVGSCYCMLQCGKPIKTKPTRGAMDSVVWLGHPDNNATCSMTEGEFLPCKLIIASRDGTTVPEQPYYIVEMIYRLAGPEPVQFAERRVSIFLDGEPVPDIKPPVVSKRETPCPSEVRFWIRADKPGPVLIHTGWNGMQPCGELHLNISPLAYMMAYAPEQAIVPPMLPPPEPPAKPTPPPVPLGNCGCWVTCTELDAFNRPVAGTHTECTVSIDFSDPKKITTLLAIGNLHALGEDPVNLYPWSIESKQGWIEFNADVVENIIHASYESAQGSTFQSKLSDPPAVKCGTIIPFLIRPTEAARKALESAEYGTLIDTAICKIGQTECPLTIYITPVCDVVKLKQSIGQRAIPKTKVDRRPFEYIEYRGSMTKVEKYRNLEPGFSGKYGFKLFSTTKIEPHIAVEWRAPDCCCLYIDKVEVGVQIDVVFERGSTGITDIDCISRAEKFLDSFEFSNAIDQQLREALVKFGYLRFPVCQKADQADCDLLAVRLRGDIISAGEFVVGQIMQPFLDCKFNCTASTSRDLVFVDARGMVTYELREDLAVAQAFLTAFMATWGPLALASPMHALAFYNTASKFSRAIRSAKADATINAIKSQVRSFTDNPCCIVVWVHGYNNSEETGRLRLQQIANRYFARNDEGSWGCCKLIGFLWNGDPFESETPSWKNPPVFLNPFNGFWGSAEWVHFGETQFNSAEMAADVSAEALRELLIELRAKFPDSPINVVTHSLGARVALTALQTIQHSNTFIDRVIVIAAAVDDNLLSEGKKYAEVPKYVGRLVVVHNRNDEVLNTMYRFQSVAGYESQGPWFATALGQYGPDPAPKYADKVELVNESFWWNEEPQKRGETKHSQVYFPYSNEHFFTQVFPWLISGEYACR